LLHCGIKRNNTSLADERLGNSVIRQTERPAGTSTSRGMLHSYSSGRIARNTSDHKIYVLLSWVSTQPGVALGPFSLVGIDAMG
jgi:hypothetical protein